ncbi:MAG: hypothetical protein H0W50_10850 [Parachlamydiaceae bacterium]|nr:hypothetical protein [Parachlamydiaceae bacterium]
MLKDSEHRYKYDSNGNRKSDGVNTSRYDALDRLLEANTPTGQYLYIYDASGRRVARLHEKETTFSLAKRSGNWNYRLVGLLKS